MGASLSLVSENQMLMTVEVVPRVTGEGPHTLIYCGAGEPRREGVVPRPKDAMLTFTMVKGDGPSLLGTDWLQ